MHEGRVTLESNLAFCVTQQRPFNELLRYWIAERSRAIWLLGVLLGIHLICEGAALGYLAWQVRQS